MNGLAKSGEVLAILGSSGAGKTTLLNALNFRNRGSLMIEGDIRLNGKQVFSYECISTASGYIQQDDIFVGSLTVKEHLIFHAMLRMNNSFSSKEKMDRVEQVLFDVCVCFFLSIHSIMIQNNCYLLTLA